MLVLHKKQWDFLKNKFEQNQLSHAYLFSGQEGIGKKTFAKEFAELVNCKFPDLMIIEPDEGKEITIAKIREIQNFLSYKSYYGSFKSVIINDAESMNQDSQNCLLKTLEEPKGKTLIFLISSKPDIILPTIFSRCQQLKFFKTKNLPENLEKKEIEKEILNSLILVMNSNFAEKFKFVKSIDKDQQKIASIIQVMQKYLRHLLLAKIGIGKFDVKDEIFSKYSICDLKKTLNLTEALNRELTFTNASPKLALEILLMEI